MKTALFFPSKDEIIILLKWFSAHGKHFPWTVQEGQVPNPYAVWVSEVMLQQTTISAVLPRFQRWMERFPGLQELSDSTEEAVLREWEGLGYYSRAKNLHSAAREVCYHYGGQLPENIEDLKSLPGVGPYIAAAICSIAFDKKVVAVDANLRRILQRIMGVKKWSRHIEKAYSDTAIATMGSTSPGLFNAAMMQFGQQLCLPRKPQCGRCIFSFRCRAYSMGLQEFLPVRIQKTTVDKTTELALLVHRDLVWVQKRKKGLLAGLWLFPSVEALTDPAQWVFVQRLESQLHVYTHYRDELKPSIYRWNNTADRTFSELHPTESGQWVNRQSINDLGMPTAHRLIAKKLFLYKDILVR